jgi:hypothetical protein
MPGRGGAVRAKRADLTCSRMISAPCLEWVSQRHQRMSASAAAFTESRHRAPRRWYRRGRQPSTGLEGDGERRLPTRRRGSERAPGGRGRNPRSIPASQRSMNLRLPRGPWRITRGVSITFELKGGAASGQAPSMTQPAPGLTADATTAPAAHRRRRHTTTHPVMAPKPVGCLSTREGAP